MIDKEIDEAFMLRKADIIATLRLKILLLISYQ